MQKKGTLADEVCVRNQAQLELTSGRSMREKASAYVEIVPDSACLKQDQDVLLKSMIGKAAASDVLGQAAHNQAAMALQETCSYFAGN